jgi:hypothetical protein
VRIRHQKVSDNQTESGIISDILQWLQFLDPAQSQQVSHYFAEEKYTRVHVFVGYFALDERFQSALLTSESPGLRRRKAVASLVRSNLIT